MNQQLVIGSRISVRNRRRSDWLYQIDSAAASFGTCAANSLPVSRGALLNPHPTSERNQLTRCVWSRSDLRRSQYHIDVCFPWSRWNNNDLWNRTLESVFGGARQADDVT
jgi:hypothetical protein